MLYALIFVIVLVLIIVSYIIYKKNHNTISFEESFNKTGLPVVTLWHDALKLNFLIDTGSDCNCIDKNMMKYIHYVETGKFNQVFGMAESVMSPIVNIRISDGTNYVPEDFNIVDLSGTNTDRELKIHGILGSNFCRKAKLSIDFKNCKIYS